jgi:hypothetical protein|tara:strand:+ start:379 stop:663 length:285 start_codon:yes stop_codon:yes gene_type:complete|eukprot:COSAG06_NODE_11270_length_1534_cov_4212.308711_1_plen_95_part_00
MEEVRLTEPPLPKVVFDLGGTGAAAEPKGNILADPNNIYRLFELGVFFTGYKSKKSNVVDLPKAVFDLVPSDCVEHSVRGMLFDIAPSSWIFSR